MRETLFIAVLGWLLCFSPACVKKRREMSIGEAESKAADIFGLRATCSGDTNGWTCFEVTQVVNGQITYAPYPVVTCRNGECHKFHSDQTTMEAR